jgi:hypothetical protein
MKMILPHRNFDSPEKRMELAMMLSLMIEGRAFSDIPYKPNISDDFFWTLDCGNDWKLKFTEDKPNEIEVYYRYHGDREQAFCYWLQFRLRAEMVGTGLVTVEGSGTAAWTPLNFPTAQP